MSLSSARPTYKPFEYPQAFEFYELQKFNHWFAQQAQMTKDVNDWNFNLSVNDKQVIGSILKSFLTTEIFVGCFWSGIIARKFKQPEIQMMANTFSGMEMIHIEAYAYLNDSLGLTDYAAFLAEPTAKAKIDRLMEIKPKNKADMARALAIFSAFGEGVQLFSSFAVLMSFSQRNLLPSTGKIVEWSVRDESLHSRAGCWLFNEYIKENPELWTPEFKETIMEAARLTVQQEDDFIDKAFEHGDLPNLSAKDLRAFIRQRCNHKLQEIGLPANWKNIDQGALARMEWFQVATAGARNNDNFASKESNYSHGVLDFNDKIWE